MIMDHVVDRLTVKGVMSLDEIVSDLPELAASPDGIEIARLLLRLDRRVQPMSGGRWALTTTAQSPERRIMASASTYLDGIPGSGALVASVVSHVASETNYDESVIRSTVLRLFVNNGKVVRNKLMGVR
jgi:hypothetical protein